MNFAEIGLSSILLHNLEKEGYTIPTPIQVQTIPVILSGANVIGVSHTGTGKTLAYALGLIERLATTDGVVLILAPTRELVMQLDTSIRKVSKGIPKMNPSLLISGVPIKNQIESLKSKPRIIIATPGRLNEHLDTKSLNLDTLTAVVLDEADRMLDSGFAPQIERVLDRSPKSRQTLMFSATMSAKITRLVERFAPGAELIKIADEQQDMSLISQEAYLIGPTRRVALLTRILHHTKGKVMIFTSSKRSAQALYQAMSETSFTIAGLHGDRTIPGRAEAIDGFRKQKYNVLITTDLGSRGIDIPSVSLVINFSVPRDHETYLHRIGRTGRAGKKGNAITFVTPEDRSHFKRLEEELGTTIPVMAKQEA